MLRALIVEDEPLARQRLQRFIELESRLTLAGTAENGASAVSLIDSLTPDLVFLDVEMPEISGIEVLERIEHRPMIVFTTAYANHAVRAFELEAFDFLVKPFGWTRFQQAVDRVVRRHRSDPSSAPGLRGRALDRLFVRRGSTTVPVAIADVIRIEGAGDYAALWTAEGRYLADVSLSELEQRLDPTRFRRVHRTHIVNLDHVASLQPHDERRLVIRFRDGTEIIGSRTGSRALREFIR